MVEGMRENRLLTMDQILERRVRMWQRPTLGVWRCGVVWLSFFSVNCAFPPHKITPFHSSTGVARNRRLTSGAASLDISHAVPLASSLDISQKAHEFAHRSATKLSVVKPSGAVASPHPSAQVIWQTCIPDPSITSWQGVPQSSSKALVIPRFSMKASSLSAVAAMSPSDACSLASPGFIRAAASNAFVASLNRPCCALAVPTPNFTSSKYSASITAAS